MTGERSARRDTPAAAPHSLPASRFRFDAGLGLPAGAGLDYGVTTTSSSYTGVVRLEVVDNPLVWV